MHNKKIIFFIGGLLLVVLFAGGYYFFSQQAKDRMVVVDVTQRVDNEDLEFSFAYESGETALSSIESTTEQLGEGPLKQMYVLMESKDMIDYQNKSEDTETPPTISVLVFDPMPIDEYTDDTIDLTAIDKIENWASLNNQFTNIKSAKSDVVETDVDGAPAIKYETDGLYSQEIYIAKYSGRMYLFVGQSMSEGDYMDTSFQKVIDSVWFE